MGDNNRPSAASSPLSLLSSSPSSLLRPSSLIAESVSHQVMAAASSDPPPSASSSPATQHRSHKQPHSHEFPPASAALPADNWNVDDLDEVVDEYCPAEGREAELQYFYGTLNLRRDADEEEIKRAYRKMAAIVHPDKHQADEKTEMAQQNFQRLQKIYEILIDPEKRRAYDEIGFDAVKHGALVAGHPQAELKRELERLKKRAERAELQQVHHTSGATRVVCVPTPNDSVPVHVALGTSQHVQSQLTDSTYLVNDSHCEIEQQRWQTSVGLRHEYHQRDRGRRNQVWVSGTVGQSSYAAVAAGGDRTMGDFTSMSAAVSLDNNSTSNVHAGVHRILTSSTVCYASCAVGQDRVLHVGSKTSVGDKLVQGGTQFTLHPELYVGHRSGVAVSLELVRRTKRSKVWMHLSATFDEGPVLTLAVKQRFTRSLRLGLQLRLSFSQIVLTPSMQLHSQALELPIPVVFWPSAGVTAAWIAGSLLVVRLLKALVVLPYERRRRAIKVAAARQRGEKYVAEARRRAEEQVELMTESVAAKRDREQDSGGLVVVEARYGVLDNEEKSIDVTIPVQYQVENGVLELRSTASKSQLAGFYDCAVGEKKQLSLRYLYKNKLLYCVVEDDEPLLLPEQ